MYIHAYVSIHPCPTIMGYRTFDTPTAYVYGVLVLHVQKYRKFHNDLHVSSLLIKYAIPSRQSILLNQRSRHVHRSICAWVYHYYMYVPLNEAMLYSIECAVIVISF